MPWSPRGLDLSEGEPLCQDIPERPRLVRQDAMIGLPRTPRLSPHLVPHQPPALDLSSVLETVQEPRVSPSPSTREHRAPSTPTPPLEEKKSKKKRRLADLHSGLAVRSRRRVRLAPGHLAEMRARFQEVMDVIDPLCPTCGRRQSDSAESCDKCC